MRKCVPPHVCVSPRESRPFERIHMQRRGSDSCEDVAARVCQNVCVFESGKPACAHADIHLSAHRTKSNTRTLAKLYRVSLQSCGSLNDGKKRKNERGKTLRLPTRLLFNQTWMSLWNRFAIRDDCASLDGDVYPLTLTHVIHMFLLLNQM